MLYSARHSEVTIFPSNESLLAALDYGPDIKNTSIVNFLAVNPSFYNSKEERCWKEKGTLNLLYVSVFYPHKDPLTLAKATKVLNNRGPFNGSLPIKKFLVTLIKETKAKSW